MAFFYWQTRISHMTKFWNFVFFQLGWFACVLGAANGHVFWSVLASVIYVAFHVWRSPSPRNELVLSIKVLLFGVFVDSLLMYMGFINFKNAWPAPYLSPIWMWALWLLVASTLNDSLVWLRQKPVLGAVLGSIGGPLSYVAGIRLGAADWGSSPQIWGVCLISLIWTLAIPLFFYWDRTPLGSDLAKNP